jgi:NAD(P)-dependent dehydrogenase (short-subunit alcohol dehydrogenase family)
VSDNAQAEHRGIVTGAGSGIGRSIARALAAKGYVVALIGRHRETLRETLPDALVVVADITDPTATDAAFAEILGQWARLDVLVNNAGAFGRSAPLEDVTRAEFDDVMAVNLTAAFWCTQHAVRAMKAQSPSGGRIVNIGSVSAHRPRPNSVAYAVSKHGLTGLTRAVALEGREHGITCTQVDIGNAATRMTASIPEATFDVAHVGEVVATIAALPSDVSVPELTMLATTMPYLGRG